MNYYGNDVENYVLAKCSGNDYLMHKQHKYIKRVWKNGKWRYYYESKSGKRTDLKLLSTLSDWYGEDELERNRRAGLNQFSNYVKNTVTNRYNPNYSNGSDTDQALNAYKAKNQFRKLDSKVDETYKEYTNTPRYKLKKTATETAKKANEISKKVEKTASDTKKKVEKVASDTKKKVEKAVSDTKKTIKDATGLTAREKAESAINKRNQSSFDYYIAKDAYKESRRYPANYTKKEMDSFGRNYEKATKKYRNLNYDVNYAIKKYENTPLGKLESVAYAGKQFIDEIFKIY